MKLSHRYSALLFGVALSVVGLSADKISSAIHQSYKWDGRDDRGVKVSRGVYLVVFRAPNTVIHEMVGVSH